MKTLVLDSYALLEWLLGQPKAHVVRMHLDRVTTGSGILLMSWINVGEVSYMLARKRSPEVAEDFLRRLPALPIRLLLPDVDAILGAARIKAKSKVAYADAFALELAVSERAGILTGDPEIRNAGLVPLNWIGRD